MNLSSGRFAQYELLFIPKLKNRASVMFSILHHQVHVVVVYLFMGYRVPICALGHPLCERAAAAGKWSQSCWLQLEGQFPLSFVPCNVYKIKQG